MRLPRGRALPTVLRDGLAADAVGALRSGTPLDDPELEAVRVFTHAVVDSRAW